MIKKIIKYDFKKINKLLFIIYLISLTLSIINLFFKYGTSDISVATFLLTTDFAFIFAFSSLFFSFIIPFTRFRTSIFKDEAYLTHTLPISKGNLYDAKILVSIISILIGMLLFGICFVYIFSHTSVTEFIKGTIKFEENINIVLTFCINFILQGIIIFLLAINSLIIANKCNRNRDLICFFLFFILFFGFYLLNNLLNLFINSLVIIILIYILINAILYTTGRIMFKRGFNIE